MGAIGGHDAVYENDVDFAKWLIASGADIHAKDENGATLLHKAATWNKPEAAMLKVGAVNVKNKYNWTPLHQAVAHNARKVVNRARKSM